MRTFRKSRLIRILRKTGGFLLLSSVVLLSSCSSSNNESESVYICLSEGAYAYHHDSSCLGLKRCSHEVRAVSLKEAQEEYGRQLCGFED